jgi:hypothetical protein
LLVYVPAIRRFDRAEPFSFYFGLALIIGMILRGHFF